MKYDSKHEWQTLETAHFFIHYHEGTEPIAMELSEYAERIQAEVSDYFQWIPAAKTHVIISDPQDSANGFAMIRPYNRIEIYATPPSSINSLEDFDNWKETVFKHEYVHIVQSDKASDFPLHMRDLLGRWGYLFPGNFMPSWMKEGIATYMETETRDDGHGIGRGQSSYFRGLMRNEWLYNFKSLGTINQTPFDWPGGTSAYLYGVYFFNFLSEYYGDDAIQKFFDVYTSNAVPFFLNSSAKRSIGTDFKTLWQEFEEYLTHQFELETARIKQQPLNSTQLTHSGYSSGFSRVTENNTVLYIDNDHQQPASIKEYNPDTQKTTTLFQFSTQSLSRFSSFDYHPKRGLLIPIVDKLNQHYPTDLYMLNLQTQKLKKITKDGRFVRAVWSADGNSIAAVQVNSGQHKLMLLTPDGESISELSAPGDNRLIGPLDWSPTENKVVASVFRPGSGWNLEILDLESQQWSMLTNNPYIESDPQFDSLGKKLLYSAEYDGVYNIYERDFNSNTTLKTTNTLTVAYQPVYANHDNVIYYAELGAKGFDLHSRKRDNALTVLVDNLPAHTAQKTPPARAEPDIESNSYNALKHLKPTWWFPILAVSQDETTVGFISNSTDPLFWHNYYLQFDFNFKRDNPGWLIAYKYQRFFPDLTLASARESYYSSIEPSQHEDLYKFDIVFPLIRNSYRISAKTGYQYTRIERHYESILGNYTANGNTKQLVSSISVDTRSIRGRAFLPYDGLFATIMLENESLTKDIEQQSRLVVKAKYLSPLFRQNILEAEATVVMSGDLTESLSVGGHFREPDSMSSFTRRNYNLKGYKSATFRGSSMQRLQLSWNLLVATPQTNIMIPPLGVSRLYLKTYAMAARVANYSNIHTANWARSIGTEIQINSDFGYKFLPFSIVAGVANGLDEKGELVPYFEVSARF